MMADGNPGALFATDRNLILLDEFADVFEADRRLVQFDFMVPGQSVNQIRGSDRLSDTIFPSAAFDQVIEQQGDDVIWLQKGPVLVHDAEAVRINLGGDV